MSFGFKYGIPEDADLVFDVRFLPNPYYVEELRPLTGENQSVRDYVMQGNTAETFIEKLNDMMDFLLPIISMKGKISWLSLSDAPGESTGLSPLQRLCMTI